MKTTPQSARASEAGFLLVGAIVMVALVLIALAVAAPVVARDLRREKEVESMHRSQEYVRAIRLYQRKFPNQYPPSIDALEKTNNIRFLRKQYVDPLTGQSDWRIIHVGENKTTVHVFFGQPLGGIDSKGIGSGLGSASSLQSGGAQNCAPGTNVPVNALAGGFAPSGGAAEACKGAGGSTATGASAAGTGTGGTGAGSSGSGSSSSPFGAGNGGPGPIMGVGSSRTGESILNPNQQTTYDTWEFLYDPRIELLYKQGQAAMAGPGGLPTNGMPAPPNSTLGPGSNGPGSVPNPPATTTPNQ